MASIFQRGECFIVQFTGLDNKRRTISLAGATEKQAAVVLEHLQARVSAAKFGVPEPPATLAWFSNLPDALAHKLAAAKMLWSGEVEAIQPKAEQSQLGPFADAYLAKRVDLKPASRTSIANAIRNLKAFFGNTKRLEEITPADADDFARWLGTGARSGLNGGTPGLSLATKGKRLQICVTLFRDAVRRKLIDANPFADIKKPAVCNPERQRYIPVEYAAQLIEATNDSEWKCLLAMSRYQGLRIPTEPFSLKWSDVDWEKGRISITCVKTSHHLGKGRRVMPILPQTLPHLQALWDVASEGAEYVFERLRNRASNTGANWGAVNLRTHLLRLIDRAGLTPWPKLWHNMRASAQTDLADKLPGHVVSQFLGNSEAVAARHYLQVTDEHFTLAQSVSTVLPAGSKTVPFAALQKAQPYTTKIDQNATAGNAKTPIFKGFSHQGMGDEGFEPPTSTV